MENNVLRVVTIKDGHVNFDDTLKNDISDLQSFVDGYIEIPILSKKLYQNKIDMVINEEGKLKDLKESLAITSNRQIVDVIRGNVVFVSHDEQGEMVSLTEEQVTLLKALLSEKVSIFNPKDDNPMISVYHLSID